MDKYDNLRGHFLSSNSISRRSAPASSGSNDGEYAYLEATPYESQATIVGNIGWEASGHIYLYGYSTITPTYLQVWVSYDDVNYDSVDNITLATSSPHWIDIGTYSSDFRYIAITLYPYGNLYIDSVLIVPPVPTTPKTETIWVDHFTSAHLDWAEVGDAPYLEEGMESYIYESGDDIGDEEYSFHFSNPIKGQGTIVDVRLKILCKQTDPLQRMRFAVGVASAKNTTTTSSAYVSYDYWDVTPPYGTAEWKQVDISSWVDSWEELDNVRLRFNYTNNYGDRQMDVYSAKTEVDYRPIVEVEKDVVILGNKNSYSWLGRWTNLLEHFGYSYAIVDAGKVSHGIINKAQSLIVAPNVVDELPGRNNLWGAVLIQEASLEIPVLCHIYSYAYQVYRQDDTNYGDGWGPLQLAYKHSNANSIKDPSGADMQNITFNIDYSYFTNGAVVPFYNDADGYLRTVNSASEYWNSYASHTIVAKEYGSQTYAAIVHGNFFGGEGILAVDLEALFSSDWNSRNLIFYPWLDKVDFEIGENKCPISDYLKQWHANGYEYLSFSEVQSAITTINNDDDGEISTFSLGQSVDSRDITALQIGSGSEVVLIIAGIHGNEKASVAGALNFAQVVDNLYRTDDEWEHLLDSHIRIVLVPCSNPDGYVNNIRNNSNNVDLNRNYDYGTDVPFSQPETRAIMNFVVTIAVRRNLRLHRRILSSGLFHL